MGGCVKEEQQMGCMERARQVWTCPPTRPHTEGTGRAETVRAAGLLRGWISGALHELCAWHRVCLHRGLRETEHPKELTGIHTGLGKEGLR